MYFVLILRHQMGHAVKISLVNMCRLCNIQYAYTFIDVPSTYFPANQPFNVL